MNMITLALLHAGDLGWGQIVIALVGFLVIAVGLCAVVAFGIMALLRLIGGIRADDKSAKLP